mmetsp:Transcript_12216/g.26947  ORF Transcript_12216/g.26947 Transcript_12216/m.26947 type:complete len:158 (-) Transcript_12216:125-598(-)
MGFLTVSISGWRKQVVRRQRRRLHTEAGIHAKDCTGNTALHEASEKGHFNIVKFLVEERHANGNLAHNRGYILHSCWHVRSKGHFDTVQFRVEGGHTDVTISGHYGDTPLLLASKNGHFDVVQFMVERRLFGTCGTPRGQHEWSFGDYQSIGGAGRG